MSGGLSDVPQGIRSTWWVTTGAPDVCQGLPQMVQPTASTTATSTTRRNIARQSTTTSNVGA
eukprot:8065865-Prorocentrum_lima.AAC.1